MLDTTSVNYRLEKLLTKHLGISDSFKFTDAMSFRDDLGADSLDCVELWMAVEEEFAIEIDDEEADSLTTIGDAKRFLSR